MVTEPITLSTTQDSKYRKRRNKEGAKGREKKIEPIAKCFCRKSDTAVEIINLKGLRIRQKENKQSSENEQRL